MRYRFKYLVYKFISTVQKYGVLSNFYNNDLNVTVWYLKTFSHFEVNSNNKKKKNLIVFKFISSGK